MCDKCGNKPSDDIKRAIYYGILKQVLKWKPVKGALQSGEELVKDTVGGESKSQAEREVMREKSDKKLTVQKMALYALASFIYDNYLYGMKPKDAGGVHILGMCPCEVYRDVYILIIQQLYNAFMIGFNVQNLITDTIAIFGSARLDGLLEKLPGEANISRSIDTRVMRAV
jgi:hypothetical protein